MIGWMPITATSTPFQAPSTSETPIAIARAVTTTPRLLWSGCLLMYMQAIAPLIAQSEPTDRSMPPVEMTRVMPSATRISGALSRRMSIGVPYRCPSLSSMDRNPGR